VNIYKILLHVGLCASVALISGMVSFARADEEPVIELMPESEARAAQSQHAGEESKAAEGRVLDLGPLHFSFGAEESGSFGVNLKGGGRNKIEALSSPLDGEVPYGLSTVWTASLGYDVDAGWSGEPDSLNNASLSLKPGMSAVLIQTPQPKKPYAERMRELIEDNSEEGRRVRALCVDDVYACPIVPVPYPVVSMSFYPDLRYRYGSFKDEAGAISTINQALLGGGVEFYAPIASHYALVREMPRLSVAYYTVLDSASSAAEIPEELKVDHVICEVRLNLNVPWKRESDSDYPLRVLVNGSGSLPTSGADRGWEYMGQVQLIYEVDGQFKPAFIYREGTEQGLKYDRQLLLGLVMELAGG
jgi:hypothetical protein